MSDSYHKYIKYKLKYLQYKEQRGGNNIVTNDVLKLKPKLSLTKYLIKVNFKEVSFSCVEYTEGPVGLTYIQFKKGAKCYMDVSGGWPAYINALSTQEKQYIDGLCIAGGSMLGLEATSGVIAESLKQDKYKGWSGINGAIIYSTNLSKNKIYPDKELGRFAYKNTNNKLYNGQVGAGLSANHGQGCYFYETPYKIKILALVVNNALGDVYKNNVNLTNKLNLKDIELNKNTTIVVLITNLDLDNDELKQMTQQVNSSIGGVIKPFNTFFDGDIFYSCSTMSLRKPKNFTSYDLMKLFTLCSSCVKEAIYNSLMK